MLCSLVRTDAADAEMDDIDRRYNLDTYEDEEEDDLDTLEQRAGGTDAVLALGLADLVVHASNADDPYLDRNAGDQDSDDERDNMTIRETDNLLLIGHVDGDAPLLEVHIHNEEDFFPHHDIVLPAYPLSLQVLSLPDKNNCVATADFTPDVCIWDLDVVNLLEPVSKLTGTHQDSVLTLSWNGAEKLASGAADNLVAVWDVRTTQLVSKFDRFKDKVQSIAFQPNEPQTLLIGDCSGTLCLSDVRSHAEKRLWSLPEHPEVECVMWDQQRDGYFFASTDSGLVYCMDIRSETPVYSISAHSDAVTAIAQSIDRNCLVTVSADKTLKVWNISQSDKASFVVQHPKVRVGRILTVAAHPELPFVFAIGGDAPSDNYRVLSIGSLKAVQQSFGLSH